MVEQNTSKRLHRVRCIVSRDQKVRSGIQTIGLHEDVVHVQTENSWLAHFKALSGVIYTEDLFKSTSARPTWKAKGLSVLLAKYLHVTLDRFYWNTKKWLDVRLEPINL